MPAPALSLLYLTRIERRFEISRQTQFQRVHSPVAGGAAPAAVGGLVGGAAGAAAPLPVAGGARGRGQAGRRTRRRAGRGAGSRGRRGRGLAAPEEDGPRRLALVDDLGNMGELTRIV